MALIFSLESDSRRYLRNLESRWDDSDPDDVAFSLPYETKKDDRVLYFVGGKFQYFVGYGAIKSNLRVGRSGAWKGQEYWITAGVRLLPEPVPAEDVFAATGFKIPRRESVVPEEHEAAVWRVARGKPLNQFERAMEGMATEARSKYRNPSLRRSALQQAGGICECCGKNYLRVAGGLGKRCLVVHHKKQLRDTDQPRETRLSELAVVCANCHMMIHADPAKALSVAALRRRITG